MSAAQHAAAGGAEYEAIDFEQRTVANGQLYARSRRVAGRSDAAVAPSDRRDRSLDLLRPQAKLTDAEGQLRDIRVVTVPEVAEQLEGAVEQARVNRGVSHFDQLIGTPKLGRQFAPVAAQGGGPAE